MSIQNYTKALKGGNDIANKSKKTTTGFCHVGNLQ